MRLCAQLFLVVAIFSANPLFAQSIESQYDWVLKRDRSAVKVYTAKVTGSKYRAVRARMLVDGRIESLVGLVKDLENCSKWAVMCKSARLEKRISSSEAHIYTLNNLPFPVRDRDVFSHVSWQVDVRTGAISVNSRALANYMPKTRGVVRVNDAVSQWVFTPQKSGQVLVESFAHVDPNGPIPAWLVNRLMISSPFKTMLRMREEIEAGAYADYQLDF